MFNKRQDAVEGVAGGRPIDHLLHILDKVTRFELRFFKVLHLNLNFAESAWHDYIEFLVCSRTSSSQEANLL